MSLSDMTSRNTILPDRTPLGVTRVAPNLYRSAIDTRTLDVKDRNVKRLAQHLVFSAAMINVGPELLPSPSEGLIHSSAQRAIFKLLGEPLEAPPAPQMRSAEQKMIEAVQTALRARTLETIKVNPYRDLEPAGIERVFDATDMLNDDFLDSYLSVMDMLHGDASRAFMFISFLNSDLASRPINPSMRRAVELWVRDERSPLSRFMANDDATLYAAFNVFGCHWVSIAWDRSGLGHVHIMDSLRSSPRGSYSWDKRPDYVADILDKLKTLCSLVEPDVVEVHKVARQPDTLSCGLFALFNIRKRALGLRDEHRRDATLLADFRRYFLAEILTQRIPLHC